MAPVHLACQATRRECELHRAIDLKPRVRELRGGRDKLQCELAST